MIRAHLPQGLKWHLVLWIGAAEVGAVQQWSLAEGWDGQEGAAMF